MHSDKIDALSEAVARYRSALRRMDGNDLPDKEVDAMVDWADAMLARASTLPVTSAATAAAVLQLVCDEEDLCSHSIFGEQFRALVANATAYLKAEAGAPC